MRLLGSPPRRAKALGLMMSAIVFAVGWLINFTQNPILSNQAIMGMGFLLFVGFSAWILVSQIQKIDRLEGGFQHAFNVEGIGYTTSEGVYALRFVVKNHYSRPIEYILDRYQMRVNGVNASVASPPQRRILRAGQSLAWALQATGDNTLPTNFPLSGEFTYGIRYGPPRHVLFQQEKEYTFTVTSTPAAEDTTNNKTTTTWRVRAERDSRLKRASHKEGA